MKESVVKFNFDANQKIKSGYCETAIKYYPIGGANAGNYVTLTNKIQLSINNLYDKALAYESPNTEGSMIGLGSPKYYIL